jgi:DNA-binding MarR family transcriptional regulator
MKSTSLALLDELPFQVIAVFLGFQRGLKKLKDDAGVAHDLVPGMGSVLFVLLEEGDCIMRDVCHRLQMPKTTLSGLVKSMESRGWVERHSCPNDGRATLLHLTKAGRGLEKALRKRHQMMREIMEDGLSETERNQLTKLLKKVRGNLRTVADDE